MKQRIFRGIDEKGRFIYTVITGMMADGTLVYTEVEQTAGGAVVMNRGDVKLVLDRQYRRQLKRGIQEFIGL